MNNFHTTISKIIILDIQERKFIVLDQAECEKVFDYISSFEMCARSVTENFNCEEYEPGGLLGQYDYVKCVKMSL